MFPNQKSAASPDDALVDLQETLYRSTNPTRRWLHCSRRDWIIDAIERHRPAASGAALEIGPGSGVYLPTLARHFARVDASDIEQSFLTRAQARHADRPNLRFLIDDITASTLPRRHYDLILCSEVIEHIANSTAALCQISGLLRPGGVLILSTPQRYSPLELAAKIAFLPGIIRIVRRIYAEPVLETGHINLLTEAQVRRQLAVAGFSILESHKSGMYLPLLAEFAGGPALRLEQFLERRLLGGWLDWLLWTQYYVARA